MKLVGNLDIEWQIVIDRCVWKKQHRTNKILSIPIHIYYRYILDKGAYMENRLQEKLTLKYRRLFGEW